MRGMGNMQSMMRQMQKMQKEMQAAQKELYATEFEVKFSGEKVMKDIQIKPEAIDPDDPDMLQDLIIEAVNQAMADIDKQTQDKLGKYTRGLPM